MISRERWQRVQPILDGALDLPDEKVAAHLDSVCGGDPALRHDVERLLAAAKQGREHLGFLGVPLDRAAARILSEPTPHADSIDPLVPDQAIGPYRIVQRIGAGGMGVVYLAHDARLDRRVALKLLPPWLATDAAALRRFTDEARAASALDHPNIATVFDIGEAGDAGLYIAMAYYDGETLEERIRTGPLPVEDARTIGAQLAEGLRAAHAKGIIHRDIKPSNVIVTPGGVAKIVDFGVAKVAGAGLATPGVTPGTLSYMSPEQTAGADVDARSDLWAVGVVMYEMVTGCRPFKADGSDDVIEAIRNHNPVPIATIRPDVPLPLAAAILRCLAKDRDERFADAEALQAALQDASQSPLARASAFSSRGARWAVVAAMIALIAGGIWVRTQLAPDRLSEPVAHRIAVLPMSEARSDPANAYLSAGMTDELIARLSTLRGLSVIAHTSVMPYGGRDRSLVAIGRTLDVRSIVEGDVSVAGDRVSVTVRLIDAASEKRLWQEQFEAALVDMPGVQRDIAARVASALQVRIDSTERRQLDRGGTARPEAYRSYLRGRYWLGKSDPSFYVTARDEFQRALDVDPTYALAWAGLADAMDHLAGSGLMASHDAFPRARAAAERALDLDPDLAEAHASLAQALTAYYWTNEPAERHFRRAVALSPSYARAHRTYAAHLRSLCRVDDALVEARAAADLDPLDFFSHWETWVALYFARRYEEATAYAQRLVDLNVSGGNVMVALVRTQQRDFEQALVALGKVDAQPHARAIRGHVYGMMGRHEDARRSLSALDGAPPEAGFWRAAIHLGLNEKEAALGALEQAYEARSWMVRLLKGEPIFDPLRTDPRFADLLKRIGFADALSCAPSE